MLSLKNKTRRRNSAPEWGGYILALVVATCAGTLQAAPVTDWLAVNASNGGVNTKPFSAAATNAPIIGNGSSNSAAQVAIYADIAGSFDAAPDVSLENGERVMLTGSVTFEGIVASREQFRWGLFYEPTTPTSAFGWMGYFATNSNSASDGGGGGNLRAKIFGNSDVFVANASTDALQVSLDGDAWANGTYEYSMTVARYGDEAAIEATLTRPGWSQQWNVSISDPFITTFDFNRVGFLSGNNMQADRVSFSDVDVTTEPIPVLTLEVTTNGPYAGMVRMVNNLDDPLAIEYYEIHSDNGSLDDGNWSSIDDQEGADPPGMGWVEGGGSGETLLSEGIVIGSPLSVASGAHVGLGNSFVPGADEDLTFFVGLADGSFLRGAVEYVDSVVQTGDYNFDNFVDAADYVMWRKANPTGNNGYTDWLEHFGESNLGSGGAQAASTNVPEPTIATLLVLAAIPAFFVVRSPQPK